MPSRARRSASPFLNNLIVFGRLLRHVGIPVHLARLADAAEALQCVDIGSRDEVYHACRALLVHRHEQLPLFDKVFEAFWIGLAGRRRERGTDPAARSDQPPGARRDDAPPPRPQVHQAVAEGAIDDDLDAGADVGMWSDSGGVANRDFAELTEAELRLAYAAIERLDWTPGPRRTRRWVAGDGSRVDLRRAMARSRRTGGHVFELPRRARRIRTRPLVLICDVSGSMERYSRTLLHFAHAMRVRHERVETFVFSTSLTRITMQLRTRRVDDALSAVAGAVPDWSGGTRIGEALRRFHQQWARRVLHHGPVVLLVSDGWDRGDPLVLRAEVARLHRSCDRLIWLNPLVGTVDYAPLTRGLQAALPYVDDFLPVRTMNDLVDLAGHLNTLGTTSRPPRA